MRYRGAVCVLTIAAGMLLQASTVAAQGGELVKATWGVPGHRVDVTARVRTYIHDNVLQLEVTRFNLGVDPAPHQVKDLVITLREWDGDVKDYSYPEKSTAHLELDPDDHWGRRDNWRGDRREARYDQRERGLRILRAYYGADGQFANVTDVLRSRVDDGRLALRVDNYSMGVDPIPGVHKRLRILYMLNGERRNMVVDEKTEVRLP